MRQPVPKPDYVPDNYPRIETVATLPRLAHDFYDGAVNCRLLPRRLTEDFTALAAHLEKVRPPRHGLSLFDARDLQSGRPAMTDAVRAAADVVIADIAAMDRMLRRRTHLRLIHAYPDPVAYEFHGDPANRVVLCTYLGATTEGLRNDQVATTRYEYLRQADIHAPVCTAKDGADIFSFRPGDIAVHAGVSGNEVAPFLHRAPRVAGTRLLLASV
jgi:hypothetical protein